MASAQNHLRLVFLSENITLHQMLITDIKFLAWWEKDHKKTKPNFSPSDFLIDPRTENKVKYKTIKL